MIKEGSRVHISSNMLEAGDNLLDVGCGQGDLYDFIKTKYAEICGVDIDLEALKGAKTKGFLVTRVDLNKEKLPFKKSSFDAVACLDVIEHLINPRHLLKEIHRVLKDGGILVISTPNVQCLYHLARLLCGHGLKTSFSSLNDPLDGGHLHYFTFKDVKELLDAYGFKTLMEDGTYNVSNDLLRCVIRLLRRVKLLRPYIATAIVVKAEKDSYNRQAIKIGRLLEINRQYW